MLRFPTSIFFTVLTLWSPPLLAEREDELSAETYARRQAQELNITVRVNMILYDLEQRIQRSTAQGNPPNEAQLVNLLQEVSLSLLFARLDREATAAERASALAYLALINWRDVIRRYGTPGGISAVVGLIGDWVVTPILYAITGSVIVSVVNVILPYEAVSMATLLTLERTRTFREMVRAMGGMQRYREIMQARMDARRRIGLHDLNEILVPMFSPEHGLEAAIVRNEGMIRRQLSRWGWGSGALTYDNLLRFLRMNLPNDPIIESIAANRHLSRDIKTASLLNYISAHHQDRSLFARMRAEFAPSIVTLPATDPVLTHNARTWANSFTDVTSIQQLGSLLRRPPEGMRAAVVARIWAEVIHPTLIENIPELSAHQAQQLERMFLPILADAQNQPNARWDQSWQNRFYRYLRTALPELSDCFSLINQ